MPVKFPARLGALPSAWHRFATMLTFGSSRGASRCEDLIGFGEGTLRRRCLGKELLWQKVLLRQSEQRETGALE